MGDQLAERNNSVDRSRSVHDANAKVLDTPRTREACRRLGLVLEDLEFRTPDSFYIPGDMKEKQNMRFGHFEKRRKERLAQVLAERAKVIAQNAKKGDVPGVQSAQFLSMLESLFDKEAKRLEGDLKNQLRQHNALVKENEEQLQREEAAAAQLALRDERKEQAEEKFKMLAENTRQKSTARQQRNEELMAKINAEFGEKQLAFQRSQLAEADRLEKFMAEKAQLSAEKSGVWKDKVEKMKEKNEQMLVERRVNGEMRLEEIKARIQHVSDRRDEEQMQRQLRSEEQQLHIMDVREQKNRIDRVDGYRRDELKEQIDGNVERIETLLALKDSLLDQRKARTLKAEATKSSRGLNIRRDCLPGPGQYEAAPSCLTEMPGVKIVNTKVNHSEYIDNQTKVTAANPAPGAYEITHLPNGDKLGKPERGGQFGQRDRDSYLDDAIRAKEQVPAPGRYEKQSQLDQRATKIKRESIADQGLDKFSAKKYPKWQRPATETPGPAGYSVDDYTRKEVLRRAQRSLPDLTKDMLRPGNVKAR